MPLYSCSLCNLNTRLKSDYKKHLLTQKHLRNSKEPPSINDKMIQNDPENIQNDPQMSQNNPQMSQNNPQMSQNEPQMSQNNSKKYQCDYCEKKFTLNTNKRRHEIHRCKYNKSLTSIIEENKQLKTQYEKEKKQLYKQIEKLIEKVGNTTNIQTNNIQLNSYGNEDLSHITDSLKTEFIKMPYGMIPKMIEHVHFNNNKPENKNIMISNTRDNKIKVFDNDKWIYKDKNDTINDLVDAKYFMLDNHYEIVRKDLPFQCQTKYIKFREFFDVEDKELVEQLKKECELVLLNNR